MFKRSLFALSKKLLFTPGPLCVSEGVKNAMLPILGSREPEFIELISRVHSKILDLAELQEDEYCSVLMQGSGTYGVESMLQTVVPREGEKLLALSNGAYGDRVMNIADILGINTVEVKFNEDEVMSTEVISEYLEKEKPTHLVCVHCETSTGMINPVKEIGELCSASEVIFCVDAMSSFGGVDFNIQECGIDFLTTSANKCIQGVPGLSIIIARLSKLVDHSRTLSLNFEKQYQGFVENGQFRFTPPIETLLALDYALNELEQETINGREKRYKKNFEVLRAGMEELGFVTFLGDNSGHIINSFYFPESKNFDFEDFYNTLYNEYNLIIYPGKVIDAEVFRIGSIGDLNEFDMITLLEKIEEIKISRNF